MQSNLGIILATTLFEASSCWKENSIFQAPAHIFPSLFFPCVSLGARKGEAHLVSVLASGSVLATVGHGAPSARLRAVTDDQVL